MDRCSRRRVLILAGALMLPSCACPTGEVCSGGTCKRLDPATLIQASRAQAVVDDLVAMGDRAPGDNQATAQYVSSQLSKAGVQDVTIEQFPVPKFVPDAGTLTVLSPASIARPLEHLVNQFGGAGDVTAALYDMTDGRLVQPAAAGKFVLIDALQTSSIRVQYQNAIDSGAAGVIFNSDIGGDYLRQRHIWRFERHGAVTGPIPAVSITLADAASLRTQLNAGQTVTLRATESFTIQSDTGYSVIAHIPGALHPEQTIVVDAHLDSWFGGAVDDAQAIGALEELAYAYSRAPPQYSLDLLAFDCEETALMGSAAYLRSRVPQVSSTVLAAVTLEMLAPANPALTVVAADPLKQDASASVWDAVIQNSGIGSLFTAKLTAADQMLAFNGEVPLDQKNFWELGIPGFYVVTTYTPFHSVLDVQDSTDPVRYASVLTAAAQAVDQIQAYSPQQLQLRPSSWYDVQLVSQTQTSPGTPLAGVMSVADSTGHPQDGAALVVTLYDSTGSPADVLDEATVTGQGGGQYGFVFSLPVTSGRPYIISGSSTGNLKSGRNWFHVFAP